MMKGKRWENLVFPTEFYYKTLRGDIVGHFLLLGKHLNLLLLRKVSLQFCITLLLFFYSLSTITSSSHTTVTEEGSDIDAPSGSSQMINLRQQQQLQERNLYERRMYHPHRDKRSTVGCFANSSRPSGGAISLYSQSTAVSTLTGTTTTTTTTEGTNASTEYDDDEEVDRQFRPYINSRRAQSRSFDAQEIKARKAAILKQSQERLTASADHSSAGKDHHHKKGILNKLFLKFGSRKCKTPPAKVYPEYNDAPTVAQIIHEMELDAEKIQARKQARFEQERIQEHVRRLREQQEQLHHHQQLMMRQQQHHLQQQNEGHDDRYGHYMNHQEIQQQLQMLSGHPSLVLTNRPSAVIKRPPLQPSLHQPPPPLPPSRPPPPPVMQKPVMTRVRSSNPGIVTSSHVIHANPLPPAAKTIIDARGVSSQPVSITYCGNDTLSPPHLNHHVMNPSAININANIINSNAMTSNGAVLYESRAPLLQQQSRQQPVQASLYETRQQQASYFMNQQQQGPPAAVYGPISRQFQRQVSTGVGLHNRVDSGNFQRQQSYPIPSRHHHQQQQQQPVYQASNVYVYSNPPSGNGYLQGDHYQAGVFDATGMKGDAVSSSSIYANYYGPVMTSSHPPSVSVVHSNNNNIRHQHPVVVSNTNPMNQRQMLQMQHQLQQQQMHQPSSLYGTVNHFSQHHHHPGGGVASLNLTEGSSV